MQITTADEAIQVVQSGHRVFVHTASAAPQALVQALGRRARDLHDLEVVHLHTEGSAPYTAPGLRGRVYSNSFFVGANVRPAVNDGYADYIPIFLSEVPGLLRNRVLPLDVAMIQVSPPDRHGFCSLGVSIDASRAATDSAKFVIAQINRHMPRTHGHGLVHISKIDLAVEHDEPLHAHVTAEPTAVERSIGRHVAELVEDGATLQLGIGAIPDAVLAALKDHKDLGIHSEMFSDGVVELVEKGVITGACKARQVGKVVGSFCIGSQRVYDFINDNPSVEMLEASYVNDTAVIRRHPKVTAINSAIEVDLTGQVCADSIGTRIYSGVGGQMDFIRGAALSPGGKPIIALPSTTRKGETRISAVLKLGAGVVTTRAHVHYIATEYGVADLYGKNLRQRARALIDIAHPDHRETLEREAHKRFSTLDWR
ncbi:acetyl-CoA hydrolase/transferase family protein [Aeoliella mucimassa]|uniref:Propionyl-CoA:succinate CoA transferase n=1 Tax=Aeoliella mucimassa TaxID=2527972 RepID=A0A518ATS3_9BACT|nr:acetyl-CoA hydrolase/transferase C-terminal domain-containing protein [Aeoliella mucimassa]QDU58134.1 Propionyl-CoA:succinate CoA transferase [Aeoliella mucimassa]